MTYLSSCAISSKIFWPVFAGVSLVLSLRVVNDADIWFQLLTGRFVIDHLQIPHKEFFIYAGKDHAQLFPGWGFGVLAELSRRMGGWTGLSVVNAVGWTLVMCFGAAAARARNGIAPLAPLRVMDMAAVCVGVLVCYQAFIDRSTLRAEVTLYVAWMAGVFLFERYRDWPARKKVLAAFPLLCFSLAWVHTTAMLMLLVFASYAAKRLLQRRDQPISQTELRWWLGSACACLLLPICNVNGAFQVYGQPLFFLLGNADTAQIPGVTFVIAEYLPLWDASSRRMWPCALILAFATLLWVALELRKRPADLVVLLPTIAMALIHRRGLGLWALALLVPLTAGLMRALNNLGERKATVFKHSAALAASALSLALTGLLVANSGKWGLGLPVGGSVQPETVARRVANLVPTGGNVWMYDYLAPQIPYLLGERYKVGYAGHLAYPNRESIEHYLRVESALPGWQEDLAKYGVKVIGAPSLSPYTLQRVALTQKLSFHPAWQLDSIEGALLIFHRRLPGQEPTAAQRWSQLRSYVENARISAEYAALAGSPGASQLLVELRQNAATLDSVRDQPERVDWKQMDRTSGYLQ